MNVTRALIYQSTAGNKLFMSLQDNLSKRKSQLLDRSREQPFSEEPLHAAQSRQLSCQAQD